MQKDETTRNNFKLININYSEEIIIYLISSSVTDHISLCLHNQR